MTAGVIGLANVLRKATRYENLIIPRASKLRGGHKWEE